MLPTTPGRCRSAEPAGAARDMKAAMATRPSCSAPADRLTGRCMYIVLYVFKFAALKEKGKQLRGEASTLYACRVL